MHNNTRTFFGFLLASLMTTSASAALYDRGNGMIYDSAQNITWYKGFGTLKTPWQTANNLTESLNYMGFSDWRLPAAKLSGITGNPSPFPWNTGYFNGTNDVSYNNIRSEIGHLFFELGNLSSLSTTGLPQNNAGLTNLSFIDPSTNQQSFFESLQNGMYWEADLVTDQPDSNYIKHWIFDMRYGEHRQEDIGPAYIAFIPEPRYFLAVRNGDVAPTVPVPAAAWLMGSGLIGLTAIKRRKK
jgi:hypothetical protein